MSDSTLVQIFHIYSPKIFNKRHVYFVSRLLYSNMDFNIVKIFLSTFPAENFFSIYFLRRPPANGSLQTTPDDVSSPDADQPWSYSNGTDRGTPPFFFFEVGRGALRERSDSKQRNIKYYFTSRYLFFFPRKSTDTRWGGRSPGPASAAPENK